MKRRQEVKDVCEALEELMKDELDAREEIGMERGIIAFVETCREIGVSYEITMAKVIEKFSVSEEKAEDYMKKHW